MSRFFTLVLAVCLTFSVTACAPKSNTTLDEIVGEINPDLSQSSSSDMSSNVSSNITLTKDELVKTEYSKKGTYSLSGTKTDYSYEYPQITVPDRNLSKINSRIRNYCTALINVELESMEQNRKIEMTKMSYSACVKNNVLSVVIRSVFGEQFTLYEAVNINIETGNELEKNDVILAAGFTSADGDSRILQAASDKFLQLYGESADYSTVDEITAYERAKAATEVDYDVDMTLFFDEDGVLKAVVRIYEPLTDDSYDYFEVKVK